MPSIIPTVGRKVWYYEDANQAEPIDGTIVRVCHDGDEVTPTTPCNVFIVEPGGNTRLIPRISASDEAANVPHYRWMPYQQAKAAEEVAKVPLSAEATKL